MYQLRVEQPVSLLLNLLDHALFNTLHVVKRQKSVEDKSMFEVSANLETIALSMHQDCQNDVELSVELWKYVVPFQSSLTIFFLLRCSLIAHLSSFFSSRTLHLSSSGFRLFDETRLRSSRLRFSLSEWTFGQTPPNRHVCGRGQESSA